MMPGEDILMKALPFGHIVKFGTACTPECWLMIQNGQRYSRRSSSVDGVTRSAGSRVKR